MNYEEALFDAQTRRLGTRLRDALAAGKKRLPVADIKARQEEFAAGWDAACEYMKSLAMPPENAYRLANNPGDFAILAHHSVPGVRGYFDEGTGTLDAIKAVGNAYLDAGDAPVAGV